MGADIKKLGSTVVTGRALNPDKTAGAQDGGSMTVKDYREKLSKAPLLEIPTRTKDYLSSAKRHLANPSNRTGTLSMLSAMSAVVDVCAASADSISVKVDFKVATPGIGAPVDELLRELTSASHDQNLELFLEALAKKIRTQSKPGVSANLETQNDLLKALAVRLAETQLITLSNDAASLSEKSKAIRQLQTLMPLLGEGGISVLLPNTTDKASFAQKIFDLVDKQAHTLGLDHKEVGAMMGKLLGKEGMQEIARNNRDNVATCIKLHSYFGNDFLEAVTLEMATKGAVSGKSENCEELEQALPFQGRLYKACAEFQVKQDPPNTRVIFGNLQLAIKHGRPVEDLKSIIAPMLEALMQESANTGLLTTYHTKEFNNTTPILSNLKAFICALPTEISSELKGEVLKSLSEFLEAKITEKQSEIDKSHSFISVPSLGRLVGKKRKLGEMKDKSRWETSKTGTSLKWTKSETLAKQARRNEYSRLKLEVEAERVKLASTVLDKPLAPDSKIDLATSGGVITDSTLKEEAKATQKGKALQSSQVDAEKLHLTGVPLHIFCESLTNTNSLTKTRSSSISSQTGGSVSKGSTSHTTLSSSDQINWGTVTTALQAHPEKLALLEKWVQDNQGKIEFSDLNHLLAELNKGSFSVTSENRKFLTAFAEALPTTFDGHTDAAYNQERTALVVKISDFSNTLMPHSTETYAAHDQQITDKAKPAMTAVQQKQKEKTSKKYEVVTEQAKKIIEWANQAGDGIADQKLLSQLRALVIAHTNKPKGKEEISKQIYELLYPNGVSRTPYQAPTLQSTAQRLQKEHDGFACTTDQLSQLKTLQTQFTASTKVKDETGQWVMRQGIPTEAEVQEKVATILGIEASKATPDQQAQIDAFVAVIKDAKINPKTGITQASRMSVQEREMALNIYRSADSVLRRSMDELEISPNPGKQILKLKENFAHLAAVRQDMMMQDPSLKSELKTITDATLAYMTLKLGALQADLANTSSKLYKQVQAEALTKLNPPVFHDRPGSTAQQQLEAFQAPFKTESIENMKSQLQQLSVFVSESPKMDVVAMDQAVKKALQPLDKKVEEATAKVTAQEGVVQKAKKDLETAANVKIKSVDARLAEQDSREAEALLRKSLQEVVTKLFDKLCVKDSGSGMYRKFGGNLTTLRDISIDKVLKGQPSVVSRAIKTILVDQIVDVKALDRLAQSGRNKQDLIEQYVNDVTIAPDMLGTLGAAIADSRTLEETTAKKAPLEEAYIKEFGQKNTQKQGVRETLAAAEAELKTLQRSQAAARNEFDALAGQHAGADSLDTLSSSEHTYLAGLTQKLQLAGTRFKGDRKELMAQAGQLSAATTHFQKSARSLATQGVQGAMHSEKMTEIKGPVYAQAAMLIAQAENEKKAALAPLQADVETQRLAFDSADIKDKKAKDAAQTRLDAATAALKKATAPADKTYEDAQKQINAYVTGFEAYAQASVELNVAGSSLVSNPNFVDFKGVFEPVLGSTDSAARELYANAQARVSKSTEGELAARTRELAKKFMGMPSAPVLTQDQRIELSALVSGSSVAREIMSEQLGVSLDHLNTYVTARKTWLAEHKTMQAMYLNEPGRAIALRTAIDDVVVATLPPSAATIQTALADAAKGKTGETLRADVEKVWTAELAKIKNPEEKIMIQKAFAPMTQALLAVGEYNAEMGTVVETAAWELFSKSGVLDAQAQAHISNFHLTGTASLNTVSLNRAELPSTKDSLKPEDVAFLKAFRENPTTAISNTLGTGADIQLNKFKTLSSTIRATIADHIGVHFSQLQTIFGDYEVPTTGSSTSTEKRSLRADLLKAHIEAELAENPSQAIRFQDWSIPALQGLIEGPPALLPNTPPPADPVAIQLGRFLAEEKFGIKAKLPKTTAFKEQVDKLVKLGAGMKLLTERNLSPNTVLPVQAMSAILESVGSLEVVESGAHNATKAVDTMTVGSQVQVLDHILPKDNVVADWASSDLKQTLMSITRTATAKANMLEMLSREVQRGDADSVAKRLAVYARNTGRVNGPLSFLKELGEANQVKIVSSKELSKELVAGMFIIAEPRGLSIATAGKCLESRYAALSKEVGVDAHADLNHIIDVITTADPTRAALILLSFNDVTKAAELFQAATPANQSKMLAAAAGDPKVLQLLNGMTADGYRELRGHWGGSVQGQLELSKFIQNQPPVAGEIGDTAAEIRTSDNRKTAIHILSTEAAMDAQSTACFSESLQTHASTPYIATLLEEPMTIASDRRNLQHYWATQAEGKTQLAAFIAPQPSLDPGSSDPSDKAVHKTTMNRKAVVNVLAQNIPNNYQSIESLSASLVTHVDVNNIDGVVDSLSGYDKVSLRTHWTDQPQGRAEISEFLKTGSNQVQRNKVAVSVVGHKIEGPFNADTNPGGFDIGTFSESLVKLADITRSFTLLHGLSVRQKADLQIHWRANPNQLSEFINPDNIAQFRLSFNQKAVTETLGFNVVTGKFDIATLAANLAVHANTEHIAALISELTPEQKGELKAHWATDAGKPALSGLIAEKTTWLPGESDGQGARARTLANRTAAITILSLNATNTAGGMPEFSASLAVHANTSGISTLMDRLSWDDARRLRTHWEGNSGQLAALIADQVPTYQEGVVGNTYPAALRTYDNRRSVTGIFKINDRDNDSSIDSFSNSLTRHVGTDHISILVDTLQVDEKTELKLHWETHPAELTAFIADGPNVLERRRAAINIVGHDGTAYDVVVFSSNLARVHRNTENIASLLHALPNKPELGQHWANGHYIDELAQFMADGSHQEERRVGAAAVFAASSAADQSTILSSLAGNQHITSLLSDASFDKAALGANWAKNVTTASELSAFIAQPNNRAAAAKIFAASSAPNQSRILALLDTNPHVCSLFNSSEFNLQKAAALGNYWATPGGIVELDVFIRQAQNQSDASAVFAEASPENQSRLLQDLTTNFKNRDVHTLTRHMGQPHKIRLGAYWATNINTAKALSAFIEEPGNRDAAADIFAASTPATQSKLLALLVGDSNVIHLIRSFKADHFAALGAHWATNASNVSDLSAFIADGSASAGRRGVAMVTFMHSTPENQSKILSFLADDPHVLSLLHNISDDRKAALGAYWATNAATAAELSTFMAQPGNRAAATAIFAASTPENQSKILVLLCEDPNVYILTGQGFNAQKVGKLGEYWATNLQGQADLGILINSSAAEVAVDIFANTATVHQSTILGALAENPHVQQLTNMPKHIRAALGAHWRDPANSADLAAFIAVAENLPAAARIFSSVAGANALGTAAAVSGALSTPEISTIPHISDMVIALTAEQKITLGAYWAGSPADMVAFAQVPENAAAVRDVIQVLRAHPRGSIPRGVAATILRTLLRTPGLVGLGRASLLEDIQAHNRAQGMERAVEHFAEEVNDIANDPNGQEALRNLFQSVLDLENPGQNLQGLNQKLIMGRYWHDHPNQFVAFASTSTVATREGIANLLDIFCGPNMNIHVSASLIESLAAADPDLAADILSKTDRYPEIFRLVSLGQAVSILDATGFDGLEVSPDQVMNPLTPAQAKRALFSHISLADIVPRLYFDSLDVIFNQSDAGEKSALIDAIFAEGTRIPQAVALLLNFADTAGPDQAAEVLEHLNPEAAGTLLVQVNFNRIRGPIFENLSLDQGVAIFNHTGTNEDKQVLLSAMTEEQRIRLGASWVTNPGALVQFADSPIRQGYAAIVVSVLPDADAAAVLAHPSLDAIRALLFAAVDEDGEAFIFPEKALAIFNADANNTVRGTLLRAMTPAQQDAIGAVWVGTPATLQAFADDEARQTTAAGILSRMTPEVVLGLLGALTDEAIKLGLLAKLPDGFAVRAISQQENFTTLNALADQNLVDRAAQILVGIAQDNRVAELSTEATLAELLAAAEFNQLAHSAPIVRALPHAVKELLADHWESAAGQGSLEAFRNSSGANATVADAITKRHREAATLIQKRARILSAQNQVRILKEKKKIDGAATTIQAAARRVRVGSMTPEKFQELVRDRTPQQAITLFNNAPDADKRLKTMKAMSPIQQAALGESWRGDVDALSRDRFVQFFNAHAENNENTQAIINVFFSVPEGVDQREVVATAFANGSNANTVARLMANRIQAREADPTTSARTLKGLSESGPGGIALRNHIFANRGEDNRFIIRTDKAAAILAVPEYLGGLSADKRTELLALRPDLRVTADLASRPGDGRDDDRGGPPRGGSHDDSDYRPSAGGSGGRVAGRGAATGTLVSRDDSGVLYPNTSSARQNAAPVNAANLGPVAEAVGVDNAVEVKGVGDMVEFKEESVVVSESPQISQAQEEVRASERKWGAIGAQHSNQNKMDADEVKIKAMLRRLNTSSGAPSSEVIGKIVGFLGNVHSEVVAAFLQGVNNPTASAAILNGLGSEDSLVILSVTKPDGGFIISDEKANAILELCEEIKDRVLARRQAVQVQAVLDILGRLSVSLDNVSKMAGILNQHDPNLGAHFFGSLLGESQSRSQENIMLMQSIFCAVDSTRTFIISDDRALEIFGQCHEDVQQHLEGLRGMTRGIGASSSRGFEDLYPYKSFYGHEEQGPPLTEDEKSELLRKFLSHDSAEHPSVETLTKEELLYLKGELEEKSNSLFITLRQKVNTALEIRKGKQAVTWKSSGSVVTPKAEKRSSISLALARRLEVETQNNATTATNLHEIISRIVKGEESFQTVQSYDEDVKKDLGFRLATSKEESGCFEKVRGHADKEDVLRYLMRYYTSSNRWTPEARAFYFPQEANASELSDSDGESTVSVYSTPKFAQTSDNTVKDMHNPLKTASSSTASSPGTKSVGMQTLEKQHPLSNRLAQTEDSELVGEWQNPMPRPSRSPSPEGSTRPVQSSASSSQVAKDLRRTESANMVELHDMHSGSVSVLDAQKAALDAVFGEGRASLEGVHEHTHWVWDNALKDDVHIARDYFHKKSRTIGDILEALNFPKQRLGALRELGHFIAKEQDAKSGIVSGDKHDQLPDAVPRDLNLTASECVIVAFQIYYSRSAPTFVTREAHNLFFPSTDDKRIHGHDHTIGHSTGRFDALTTALQLQAPAVER